MSRDHSNKFFSVSYSPPSYSEKYSSNSIEDIMKKHNALKRASYPSRLKESGAKENENNVQ